MAGLLETGGWPDSWLARSSRDGVDAKIARLDGLWARYARSLNITGANDVLGRSRHIGESVGSVVAVESSFGSSVDLAACAWLDVGSGGGFPGLVVGALWPGPVVMVEPRAKRVAFLEMVVGSMGWRDRVTVRRGRVDGGELEVLDGGGRLERGFSVVGARAWLNPEAWLVEAALWGDRELRVVVHANPGWSCPEGWTRVGYSDGLGFGLHVVSQDPAT